MKRYSFKIGVGLMALVLLGFNALKALANTRPFHPVEHGTLTPNGDGSTTAGGSGTATHLGNISVRRTFTLTPTSVASPIFATENTGDRKGVAVRHPQIESCSLSSYLSPVTNNLYDR